MLAYQRRPGQSPKQLHIHTLRTLEKRWHGWTGLRHFYLILGTRGPILSGMSTELTEQIGKAPKAELHIHLEGSFRWSTVRAVHPSGQCLPEIPPWLEKNHRFRDFQDFVQIFRDILRPATGTPETIERHTFEILADLAAQNVRYVEMTIGPGFHTEKGMSLEGVLKAIFEGRARAERAHAISCHFLLGINRDLPLALTRQTVSDCLSIAGPKEMNLISGIDLQGDERVNRFEDFRPLFEKAREAGLRVRAHAGELCGARSIRSAIEILGVDHIAHGVRAVEDPDLVDLLANNGVYLHLCPSSNLALGVCPSWRQHPLPRLLEAGCKITISSDDPLLFGVTITDELRSANQLMGLARNQIQQLLQEGFRASMLDEPDKKQCIEDVGRALRA